MSLRLRLTLFFSAFIAVILSAVAISVYVLTESSLLASLEDRAAQALSDLTQGVVPVTEGLQKLPGDMYYQIIILGQANNVPENPADVRNGIVYSSAQTRRMNPTSDSLVALVPDAALQALITKGQAAPVSTSVTLADGDTLRVLAELGKLDRPAYQASFEVAMFVGIPSSSVKRTVDQLARDLGLTVLIAFLVFAIGVWLLSGRVLAPLKRVTAAAARVSGQDLTQRVPVPQSHDELREMAETINHMLERLQESFETQRRFTADASHELRTPVTAIVGHANYVLRRTHPTAEQVDSLTVIRREADRMSKLVNDLLELARADAGFALQRAPMNLVEVAEAVHMEMAPVIRDVQIEVHTSGPVVEVVGDPARLKQVVLNLVQNAVNAGAKDVRISVTNDRQDARLEVLDDGPGIPPEAIPHLFERFFRVDGARSTRGNGSGLGLPIVRWIVHQHGGSVTVESRLGEGTVFTVLLPLYVAKRKDVPEPQATSPGLLPQSMAKRGT